MPEFDKRKIQMYLNELKAWQTWTEMEKNKQGPIVWLSLLKEGPKNIKQLMRDWYGGCKEG